MKFSDLKVEYIKTLAATQRILLSRWGYAISFMGSEQNLVAGDGVTTFQIAIYPLDFKIDEDLDFFYEDYNPNIIDFDNLIFKMDNVNIKDIEYFFEAFIK